MKCAPSQSKFADICYFLSYPADGLYSAVSTQLVKRSQKMMEKHRQLLFDESTVSVFENTVASLNHLLVLLILTAFVMNLHQVHLYMPIQYKLIEMLKTSQAKIKSSRTCNRMFVLKDTRLLLAFFFAFDYNYTQTCFFLSTAALKLNCFCFSNLIVDIFTMGLGALG